MEKIKESLSIEEARKLILLSQKLPPGKQSAGAVEATLSAFNNLGYIQIDTISVVQRAHHHTLWNRNPRYENSHIDKLLKDKKIFEYWSHAAAYLPMSDYRYTLLRKQAIESGEEKHWYKQDEKMMKRVFERIQNEGALMAKDFEGGGKKVGGWGSKPTKQALENLVMHGKLMIPYRVNFHKVYDLTERVLDNGIDMKVPSRKEYANFLILKYLKANGIGKASEIIYLLKNMKVLINDTLKEMIAESKIREIEVFNNRYYVLEESLELLKEPLARKKLKILSPFDNLIIQRKRIKELFEFEYIMESYTSKEKRQYGYFSLPILWDSRLLARMDCKSDRKNSILHIYHLALEKSLIKTEEFFIALTKELKFFLEFNGCEKLLIHRTSPSQFKEKLESIIHSLS